MNYSDAKSAFFNRRGRTALLCGAALMLSASPAFAQDDAASSASTIETTRSQVDGENVIIVTARNYVPAGSITASKSDIPLIETPQSISVITRDQIDLLSFVDAQQAVRYTAGVFGENYGPDPRFDFFTVRGFTPKQYIDGLAAPITTTISSVGVDLYGFQSLDVLKGPSSVLYGNAPPGGIYNQTTRRAADSFGGEAQIKYGTDDFKQIAGSITGPVSDGLSVRVTALYRDRDDTVDFLNAKRFMVAPTATIKLGTSTKLTPLFYYQYDVVKGGNGGFLPGIGTLFDNPNGLGKLKRSTNLGDPNNKYTRRQWGAGYDFEHKFGGDFAFRSNTKWSHYVENTSTGIYNANNYIETTDPTDPDYFRTIAQANFPYLEEVSSFATDNRIEAELGMGEVTNKILVGIDYRNVLNKAAYGFFGGPGFAGIRFIDAYDPVYTPIDPAVQGFGQPTRYNDTRLKQTGIYAQDQIKFGQLIITLGGRYDWVSQRYATNTFFPITTPAVFDKKKQHKFTWRAGANYVTDSGFTPYVSYATSFEPVLGTDSVTLNAFVPSTGRQWEGGVKYDARGLSDDVKLWVTAALFDIKQNNVVAVGGGSTPQFGTQTGTVEVWGGEFELVARIREQLSINGSYSYNHSEVTKSATTIDVGTELPTTPKHKLSLFVDYTFAKGPLGGFGAGFGGRYTSKSIGGLVSNGGIYADDSTLFDAIVHYDVPGWRFAVNGSNIFDKKYVARCGNIRQCFYGASRQIMGTVTKKF